MAQTLVDWLRQHAFGDLGEQVDWESVFSTKTAQLQCPAHVSHLGWVRESREMDLDTACQILQQHSAQEQQPEETCMGELSLCVPNCLVVIQRGGQVSQYLVPSVLNALSALLSVLLLTQQTGSRSTQVTNDNPKNWCRLRDGATSAF
eukprot:2184222-Amphidinium_carterae.1